MNNLAEVPPFTTLEIATILSLVVAFLAVIVGPIVSYRLARWQLISSIRQKWIDELRDLVSTLLSRCRMVIITTESTGLLVLENSAQNQLLLNEILFLEQKLQLMLNPAENDHQLLMKHVAKITDAVQHGAKDIIKFGQQLSDASACCKGILKREWERVKYGER